MPHLNWIEWFVGPGAIDPSPPTSPPTPRPLPPPPLFPLLKYITPGQQGENTASISKTEVSQKDGSLEYVQTDRRTDGQTNKTVNLHSYADNRQRTWSNRTATKEKRKAPLSSPVTHVLVSLLKV